MNIADNVWEIKFYVRVVDVTCVLFIVVSISYL